MQKVPYILPKYVRYERRRAIEDARAIIASWPPDEDLSDHVCGHRRAQLVCQLRTPFQAFAIGVPVIVLSNNDGCAIARSEKAKRLGVKMGMPWFQIRKELGNAGIVALSANFSLYGDLSNRMMSVAAGLGPTQEVYSIDESFIGLDGMPGDLTARADHVRHRIRQWVGIPCGIGIGTTKTLAKLANHVAKAADRKPGSYPPELAHVCNLAAMSDDARRAVLAATPLDEIWGVGRRLSEQLRDAGLATALDVACMDPSVARSRWSVVFERTVRELQGISCIALDDAPAPRKEIASTRSFGHPVQTEHALAQAVTEFVSRAAEKLRRQESLAGRLMVFIHYEPISPWRTAVLTIDHSPVAPADIGHGSLGPCGSPWTSPHLPPRL